MTAQAAPAPSNEPKATPRRPPRIRSVREVEEADPTVLAMMSRAQVDELSAAARSRRVEILNVRKVEETDPTVLAMMSRAQVDELAAAARSRRVEILLADRTTEWYMDDIATYCHVDKDVSVAKWRWRQRRGIPLDGRVTVLPPPLRMRRDSRAGAPRPVWLMSDILLWAAQKVNRCDRHDYVAFPQGRKRTGRPPNAAKVAPAQRTSSDGQLVGVT